MWHQIFHHWKVMDPFLLNEKMVRFFQRRNAVSFREIFPSRKTHESVGAFGWKCRRSFWSFPKLRKFACSVEEKLPNIYPKWWWKMVAFTTVKVKKRTTTRKRQTQEKKMISRREAALIFLWYCICFSQHWVPDLQVSMGPFDPHNPSKLSMISYAQFNNHPMNLLVHHHCAWKLPKKWLLFPSWMEKNKRYHPYHH